MSRILLFSQDPENWITGQPLTRESYDQVYNNTGNLVWCYAISKILHHPSNIIQFNRPFTKESAEEVNANFDHVVFSFANVISRRQIWRLERIIPFLSHLKIPVTVCSIGAQADHGDFHLLDGIQQTVKDVIGMILDRSPSIGVRGLFTAEYLCKLGFSDHVRVIGCPSFYMAGPKDNFSKLETSLKSGKAAIGDTPIIRSLLDQKARGLFGEEFDVVSQSYIGEDAMLDYEELRYIQENRMFQFTTFHSWMEFAKTHCISLSGRIHGTVVALHSGIPAILIAVDKRTEELGIHLGIPLLHKENLSQVKCVNDLMSIWRNSNIHQSYEERFSNFISYLDEQKLTHWQSDPPIEKENYYENILGKEIINPNTDHARISYSYKHPLYTSPKTFLLKRKIKNSSEKTLSGLKTILKRSFVEGKLHRPNNK